MEAIVTNSLSRSFGQRKAVNNVSLTVHEGEFFSLLGVNGAGKTTLIRMLCCLCAPTSGSAQVLGQDIVHQAAQVKSMIAVSPQETAVAGNLTVRENLELMAGVYGHSAAECRALAHEMMDRLRLNEVANQRAKTLSGGWMRRLSIAMALVSSPRVLFLDEPTLGLDVLARRELWSVIRSLRGHTALVLTTHYLEEAEALSDRIGIMSHGHLIALGTAQELIEKTGESSFENAFIALGKAKVSIFLALPNEAISQSRRAGAAHAEGNAARPADAVFRAGVPHPDPAVAIADSIPHSSGYVPH